MIKLDNNFLVSVGLGGLSSVDKNKMLNHIYETLEGRVGMYLAERMTEQQLLEFEQCVSDPEKALQWLAQNFPDYQQVVRNEFEKLKNEIIKVAPRIVADSQTSSVQQSQSSVPHQNNNEQQIRSYVNNNNDSNTHKTRSQHPNQFAQQAVAGSSEPSHYVSDNDKTQQQVSNFTHNNTYQQSVSGFSGVNNAVTSGNTEEGSSSSTMSYTVQAQPFTDVKNSNSENKKNSDLSEKDKNNTIEPLNVNPPKWTPPSRN